MATGNSKAGSSAAQVNKRKKFVVTVPFPWRGHWTRTGQLLELLDCESQALLITQKITLDKGGK
ncbi:hypothetical protein [Shewanella frigidimarina]|uniref:hypothetical protein n=1 Tax=Shewanella frigidimarina TaxID=56812 RepID=UPI003D7B7DA1